MEPADIHLLAHDIRMVGRWLCHEHENEIGGAFLKLASHIKRRAQEIERAGLQAFVFQVPSSLEIRIVERMLQQHSLHMHHISYTPICDLTTVLATPA